MSENKIMKILAAIFLMRCVYWHNKGEHGIGIAYDNAFDMLVYAVRGEGPGLDCLRQFGWFDEAEDLINKVGEDIDFWDLEDLIKKENENE